MSDEQVVTFHPMQPGWYFHHYVADSHKLSCYPVVGFESISLRYAPDPERVPNADPRLVEARVDYVGTDSVVAIVLTGRPGEVTFRFFTEDDLGPADGRSENWLGLYPSKSTEELHAHFRGEIEAMRENLRKAHQPPAT
ncbi:MAG: hypothetical protein V3R77_07505 [Candidatus Binatia bacterium]